MPELLGVLLALVIAGLAWGLWRGLCWLGRWLRGLLRTGKALARPAARRQVRADGRAERRAWLRGLRIRTFRALARSEADRAEVLASELARLRVQLRAAEKERDQLRARQSRPRTGPDEKFQRAKRAFAVQFHPDRITASGTERLLRIAMFKSYWDELRKIEKG